MIYKILIDGMKCANCRKHITDLIESFPNVKSVEVSLDTNEATIEGEDINLYLIKAKIEESGKYKVFNEEERHKLKPRDDDAKKKLINRMKRMIGQLNGIMKMIEDDRYCADILIQLSAISKSLESVENSILESHIKSCVLTEIQSGNTEIIDEVMELFRRLR